MTHPLLIVSQSDSLYQIVDINSHTEWQTVQIQISWLQKPTDLDLHCLQRQGIFGLSKTRVKCLNMLEQYSLSSKGLDKGVLQINMFFLFLSKNMLCYSEVPQKDSINEYPQYIFLWRNKKILSGCLSYLNSVLYIIYSIICFSFLFQEAYFQLVVGNETADTTVSELVSVVRTFFVLYSQTCLRNPVLSNYLC